MCLQRSTSAIGHEPQTVWSWAQRNHSQGHTPVGLTLVDVKLRQFREASSVSDAEDYVHVVHEVWVSTWVYWFWLQAPSCAGSGCDVGDERIAETRRSSFGVQSHFFTHGRTVGDTDRMMSSFELKKSDYIHHSDFLNVQINRYLCVTRTMAAEVWTILFSDVSVWANHVQSLVRSLGPAYLSLAHCSLPIFRVRCYSRHHLL